MTGDRGAAPDLQPTLEGELVIVRPIEADDWEAMFAAGSDPRIWEVHPQPDRYREPLFRRYFDGAIDSGSGFAILDKGTRRIIGSSRYYGHDAALGEIEIGWTFLVRDRWGGTYNREVKRLMLGHALAFVDTVVFFVGEHNGRSQRAMEKIGGSRRPGLRMRDLGTGPLAYVVYEFRKGQPLP